MANAVDDRHRAAVIMLAGSGLRIGEQGLRVDFLRRTVRSNGNATRTTARSPTKDTEVHAAVRPGRPRQLAHRLAAHPSREWLFTAADDGPLFYRAWQYGWDRARAEVGLRTDTRDLRHFFASALISGGAPVKQVQTTVGHSSAVTTLQIYAHMWPGDDDRTRGGIDNILGSTAGAATA
ncbi:MAG TPA: tyrosine-type recombinase/integrase [Acidothermaceae bacterium]|jgi:integrase